MELPIFKIRCSASGNIYTESNCLTEIQNKKVSDLQKKNKLTEKQEAELDKLIYKRDNPELSQTAKSYCELWVKEKIYKRRKSINSKYFEKGNECEQSAIDRYNNTFGTFGVKNENHFENDYITGTPDMLLPLKIVDIKNSYDFITFPLFKNKIDANYYGQLQGYMHLTGRKKAELVYCLENLPEELIEQELYKRDLEYTQENEADYIYDNIDNKYRIKVFKFDYDPEYISNLEKSVILCREYIQSIKYRIL